jgi:curved DNA-binding protein CbpA
MSVKEDTHVQRDLYEILGVDRNASQEEIKKNYNELVLLYHPDKGGDPKKFKDLQIAYKILSNEKNRKLYTESLSSTFSELKNYYDEGMVGYEVCEDDFARAQTDEEKKRKKDEFMSKFDNMRDNTEKNLFDQMKKELDAKPNVKPTEVPTYDQLLRQQEAELLPPTIECLLTDKFDVNLFNQIFEKNKQTQCRDMEPYGDVREQGRTDLAPVDNTSIFVAGFNSDSQDRDFFTYKTNIDVDKSKFDLSSDITRTRDKVYEDADNLLAKYLGDRHQFDDSIRKEPPPTKSDVQSEDMHPLSYQNMGLNFMEFKN